jgi:hypothetical protein
MEMRSMVASGIFDSLRMDHPKTTIPAVSQKVQSQKKETVSLLPRGSDSRRPSSPDSCLILYVMETSHKHLFSLWPKTDTEFTKDAREWTVRPIKAANSLTSQVINEVVFILDTNGLL